MSNRGLALYHTKEYDEAVKAYREIIKRDPRTPSPITISA